MPGTGTIRARLPTAVRIDPTSSRKVGRLGTDRVDDAILAGHPHLQAQLGQVVDVDPTDPVVAPATDREHREVSEQPGDVVDQHAVAAEEDGRSEDGVGEPAAGQGALDAGPCPGSRGRGNRGSGW